MISPGEARLVQSCNHTGNQSSGSDCSQTAEIKTGSQVETTDVYEMLTGLSLTSEAELTASCTDLMI